MDRALRFPNCPIVKVTRYQGRSSVVKAQPCKVRDKEWCRWLTSKLIYIFISSRMDEEIKYRWRIMCSWVQVFKFLVQSTASKLKVLLADFLFLLIFALVQRKYPICSQAWSLDRSSTRDYYSVAEDLFCIVVKKWWIGMLDSPKVCGRKSCPERTSCSFKISRYMWTGL